MEESAPRSGAWGLEFPAMWREKLFTWRSPRTLARTLLQLDDTPHSIALGAAIGMWIALTPTVGIQMLIVLAVSVAAAPFFRFNRIAGVVMVYVSNPITMIPLYWFNYKVGTLFVEGSTSYEEFRAFLRRDGGADAGVWEQLMEFLVAIGWPLIVGSAVVCTASALLTYPAVLWMVKSFRSPRACVEASRGPAIGNGPTASLMGGDATSRTRAG